MLQRIRRSFGFEYAKGFTQPYGVLLAVSIATGLSIARRDRRGLAVVVLVLANLGYVTMVGSDTCRYSSRSRARASRSSDEGSSASSGSRRCCSP